MAVQRDHDLYPASHSLSQTPASVEDVSAERVDIPSTSFAPEARLPALPAVEQHRHHHDSTAQPHVAQIPTAAEDLIREDKSGMAAQWKQLNSVGKTNFGLDFICLFLFLLKSRMDWGSPGDNPEKKVFDDAFERTTTTVIGTERFINERQYRITKLKDIYNSIQPVYDDGAGILKARILEFYTELCVAPGLERDTDEWRIAMRATAKELAARPGGYLHLVCTFHLLIT